VIEKGEADLVLDIANPIPAIGILDVLGLPMEDWKLYAEPFHEIVYAPAESAEWIHANEGMVVIAEKLAELIDASRRRPGDGFIDNLVRARVEGEPIPDESIIAICMDHLAGGVDTTTGMLANAFVHLDEHPEARDRLRRDPAYLRLATEEFLRWVAPIRMLARTVTRDTELGGQALKAGDRLLVSFSAANRDDAAFDDPDKVVLDRFPNRHAAFGMGIHRCIGSNLARTVFQIVLRDVLARMPDYRIDRGRAEKYKAQSVVNGWVSIPATFTPGPRKGSGLSLPA
jgi:cytochrome P450